MLGHSAICGVLLVFPRWRTARSIAQEKLCAQQTNAICPLHMCHHRLRKSTNAGTHAHKWLCIRMYDARRHIRPRRHSADFSFGGINHDATGAAINKQHRRRSRSSKYFVSSQHNRQAQRAVAPARPAR